MVENEQLWLEIEKDKKRESIRMRHWLKPTKRVIAPRRIVFVDTETTHDVITEDPTPQDFRLGVACLWRRKTANRKESETWFEFADKGRFWDWLIGHTVINETTILVAHNAKFDLLVLGVLEEIPSKGWIVHRLYEKGMTFFLSVSLPTEEFQEWIDGDQDIEKFEGDKWRRRIRVIDNGNLYPGTLEALGESIGAVKMAMPASTESNDAWFPYCRQDVNVMLQAWRKRFEFLSDNNLGSFKYTVASQSFESFRHRFQNRWIQIHADQPVLDLEREAYRGGRTECFFVGRPPAETVYKLDVNSMYPYVMHKYAYPYEMAGYRSMPTREYVWRHMHHHAVVAAVDLVVTEPIFPFREKGRNVYPVGHLNIVLTTNELRLAFDRGWVREIDAVAWYHQARLFTDFMAFFYPMKVAATEKGDPVQRLFSKLLLNTSYGKWGQKGRTDSIIGRCGLDEMSVEQGHDLKEDKDYTITHLHGLVYETYEEDESFNSFPAIAAHVTANARLYLWELIQTAGRENVYYCDTDSVFTNSKGKDRLAHLVDSRRLGYLKVEGESKDVLLHGLKDYEWSGKATIKGIPHNAPGNAHDGFEVEYWPSFTTHLERGWRRTFYNTIGKRKPKRGVNWGNLEPDGWVTPYNRG